MRIQFGKGSIEGASRGVQTIKTHAVKHGDGDLEVFLGAYTLFFHAEKERRCRAKPNVREYDVVNPELLLQNAILLGWSSSFSLLFDPASRRAFLGISESARFS